MNCRIVLFCSSECSPQAFVFLFSCIAKYVEQYLHWPVPPVPVANGGPYVCVFVGMGFCRCVRAGRATCRLPFLISHLLLTPQKEKQQQQKKPAVEQHTALCKHALGQAPHTQIQTHTVNKISKVTNTHRAGNLKKHIITL